MEAHQIPFVVAILCTSVYAYIHSLPDFPQLSGTEILDAIDNEVSGTLKGCYITLGMYTSWLVCVLYVGAEII